MLTHLSVLRGVIMRIHKAGNNELRPVKISGLGAAVIDLKSAEEREDFITGYFIM